MSRLAAARAPSTSRSKGDETKRSAIAFLNEAAAAPFRLTHVLTDNGSCFTPAFAEACKSLGAQCRYTRPRTPQTRGTSRTAETAKRFAAGPFGFRRGGAVCRCGMVERLNGRIGSEVLGIATYSHRQLEQLLRGFNQAYNTRRQRVLDSKTPNQVVAEHLNAEPKRANPAPHGGTGPCDAAKARLIADRAKEASQLDTLQDGPDVGSERQPVDRPYHGHCHWHLTRAFERDRLPTSEASIVASASGAAPSRRSCAGSSRTCPDPAAFITQVRAGAAHWRS